MSQDLKLSEIGWDFAEDDSDDPFIQGLKDLEENWFNKASLLTTDLVSPIHDAAAKGNITLLQAMLDDGYDMNKKDNANNIPLHWAAGAGHTEAVRMLVACGSDLNAQNMLGDTPLHRAAWRGQYEACKLLLEGGTDVSIKNTMGKKAIELVRDNVDVGALIQGFDREYLADTLLRDALGFDYDQSDSSGEYDSDNVDTGSDEE
eukprot:TRINITY_DN3768_c0_g2_i2.p1 TRINITY_DN3768_c0_g2~~TRINITY_DN3768_c0_g2_i2.p1  ORF type:complete len:211 (-),score=65.22 TRINITY_DN3768_c0_g2_i2:939-1550(-)